MTPKADTTAELVLVQPMRGGDEAVLTPEALQFLAALCGQFASRRGEALENRKIAQDKFNRGELPDFHPETADIRAGDWRVAPPPKALEDRRVEITAPAERKKIIQALNSPAKAYMADFEDSMAPTWENLIDGQIALREASRGKCEMEDPARRKHYALNPDHQCTLIVRPRGWHLPEPRLTMNGAPIPGALMDFGLFFFHNAKILSEKGRGPFFYLPKVEHWREAQLWEDVMSFAESRLGLPQNTARATLLIETLPAVFQMHEILHAMRGRLVGLNCGRWDYIFSYIKTLRAHADRVLPERNQVGMIQPFLRAYSRELIQTCHQRGAHAMGGMSAFIPIAADPKANEKAMAQVTADKKREAGDGHDGTWVAHPGLIGSAAAVFDDVMPGPHQKEKLPGIRHTAEQLLAPPPGTVTADGVDNNIQVAIRYIAAWLAGSGAVPIFNLMEDAATAEIARAQLWQWRKTGAKLEGGGQVDSKLLDSRIKVHAAEIASELGEDAAAARVPSAAKLLGEFVRADELDDFLTLRAMDLLN